MSMMIELAETAAVNPLDAVEDFVDANEWPADRSASDEMTVGVSGKWCDFHLWVSWRPEISSMHFACVFDLKVPASRQPDLHELLALANERMSIGHFDVWRDEGLLLFRHALLLGRDGEVEPGQIEALFDIAFTECERFFPAVQYVLWGGKSAAEAADTAMMECVGEA
ncbi:MAG: YbjN domain-containing protein [Minwuia sp.]|uniref:YbjN domain-containing protein n=1 Tax=Minwuia sp. TaxID=2493630 RepID=UPI003A87F2FC